MDSQLFSVTFIIVDFLLILFLTRINRRIFIDLYKSISLKSKVILLLIIAIFSIVVAVRGFNFKAFVPSDEEWVLMRLAKELVSGGQILNHLRYGFVYPLLLSFGFLIFGVNPLVGSVMTFIFGLLSILLIFAISQLLFKNEKIGLLSAGIYTISPLFYIFTTLQMGYPATVNFFLLLFVLASVLSILHHKTSLYVLSLVLIAVTAQIKPEYFILIVPYGLCFILFKEYKHIKIQSLLSLIILFLILSSPYFIQNANFKESYASSSWCGDGSLVGNTPVYSKIITNLFDPVIKFLINDRFSINYFVNKIPSFLHFWSYRSLAIITPVIVLGIQVALKKHTKLTLYLLSIFFSINVMYLSDCFLYEARYIFPMYGLVVLFFGMGLNYLVNLVGGGGNYKTIIKNVLLIIFSVLTMMFLYFYEYKDSLLNGSSFDHLGNIRSAAIIRNNNIDLNNIIRDLPINNAFILVPHINEENILKIKGYKAISLTDIEAFNVGVVGDYKNIKLPLEMKNNNYYFELDSCNYPGLIKRCKYVKDNYTLILLNQVNNNVRVYKILSKKSL